MTQPDPARSRVLIIGVSAYTIREPLPAVANGVTDLAALLSSEDLWGVRQPDHCRVLLNPPSNVEVMAALRKAAAEAEDALVVYFAGHGTVSDERKLYLDLPSADGRSLELSVSYDAVRRVMQTGSNARQKVVILDCCFSGLAMDGAVMGGAGNVGALAAVDGAFLMTSSRATQESMSFPGERYPAFSGALIGALAEGIAYSGPLLEMETLFTNVVERLSRLRGRVDPQRMSNNDGPRIALVRNRNLAPPDNATQELFGVVPPVKPPGAPPLTRPPSGRDWRKVVLSVAVGVALVAGGTGAAVALWPDPKPPKNPTHPTAKTPPPVCTDPHPEEIHLAASADLSATLAEAAAAYKPHKSGGHCFGIVVDEQNSGSAMRALAKGWQPTDGTQPDIWSPASTVWLQLAKDKATPETRKLFPDGSSQSIVTSPLVIAVPGPMADVLKKSKQPFGWRSLAEAAKSAPLFWNNQGQPKWGEFKLGKTNPGYSASGLNATLATAVVATGTSTGLTSQDVTAQAAQDLVRNTERAVVHYGDTSLTFMQNLRRIDDATTKADPDAALHYISAVTVEEQAVVAYNMGYPCGTFSKETKCKKRDARPHTRLVALYPDDGTLYSDHPFIELTTISPEKKAVADDFLAFLRTPAVKEKFDQLGFRTSDGGPTRLLKPANGAMAKPPVKPLPQPQPGALGTLLDTWPSLRKKAHVNLLIDTSGSMGQHVADADSPRKMQLLQDAAPQLFEWDGFTDEDQLGLWSFANTAEAKVPIGKLGRPGGPRRKELAAAFDKFRPYGTTALYDCISDAVDQLRAHYDPSAINAVVVLTDGRNDPEEPEKLTALLAKLEDHSKPVRVFTIGYGNGTEEEVSGDKSILEDIADAADGHFYDAKDRPADIAKILVNVISNF